jgi:Fe-S oxidoreductase
MEESIGTRIGTARAEEAVATGASVVATACPFCTVMLSDGVAASATDRQTVGVPEVTDIALLLLDRVRE